MYGETQTWHPTHFIARELLTRIGFVELIGGDTTGTDEESLTRWLPCIYENCARSILRLFNDFADVDESIVVPHWGNLRSQSPTTCTSKKQRTRSSNFDCSRCSADSADIECTIIEPSSTYRLYRGSWSIPEFPPDHENLSFKECKDLCTEDGCMSIIYKFRKYVSELSQCWLIIDEQDEETKEILEYKGAESSEQYYYLYRDLHCQPPVPENEMIALPKFVSSQIPKITSNAFIDINKVRFTDILITIMIIVIIFRSCSKSLMEC